jgi:hypothetical protein
MGASDLGPTKCLDQVYWLSDIDNSEFAQPLIWIGDQSLWSCRSYEEGIQEWINQQVITEPGVYIVIREDHSLDPDKPSTVAWVGMVNENMTLVPGPIQVQSAKTPMVTRWPPKDSKDSKDAK